MTPDKRRALFRLSPWRRAVARVVSVLTMCVTNISSVTLKYTEFNNEIGRSVEIVLVFRC